MGLVIGRKPTASHKAAKPTSKVWIGDDICVTVLNHHGHIRLDIDAPKEKKVLRGELKEQLEQGDAE